MLLEAATALTVERCLRSWEDIHVIHAVRCRGADAKVLFRYRRTALISDPTMYVGTADQLLYSRG